MRGIVLKARGSPDEATSPYLAGRVEGIGIKKGLGRSLGREQMKANACRGALVSEAKILKKGERGRRW